MLQFFRSFFNSRVGVALTVGLLIIIALAFAAGDVASNSGFGGIGGGDKVAIVGKQSITTADLVRAATLSVDNARAQDPKLTMKGFLAQGGLDSALSQLIDRIAMAVFGQQHGIVAGNRLIGSELAKVPSLQGPDGKFSDAAYRQLLAQRRISDDDIRQDLSGGLIAREILEPVGLGATVPPGVIAQYAALLKEHRDGQIVAFPATIFAPKTPPSAAAVAAFYTAHRAAFMLPERRTIRYAVFDDSAIRSVPAPTEAQITAFYQANKVQYTASELRKLTQTIVPDEAGARAIAADVAGGKSLETAVAAHGLSAASLGQVTRDGLAAQSSTAVAEAGFAARRGGLAAPVKGALGWYLLRVDAVDNRAGKTLDQARGEIGTALTGQARKAALADLTVRTQDAFDKGGALSDAAKAIGIVPQTTRPLTADGQVFGVQGQTAPKELVAIVPAAFQMEHEAQPQLAPIDAGKRFVIFDIAGIARAAPAPLNAIGGQVAAVMMLRQGAVAAQAAAHKVLAQINKGTPLPTALASLGVALPPVQPVSMGREQLAAQKGQVPAPLSLLFAMAQGTAKLLPVPGDRGWIIVQLNKITPGTVVAGDPILADATKELGDLTGREYAEEIRAAIRKETGVTRKPAGIRAAASQLAGSGGS